MARVKKGEALKHSHDYPSRSLSDFFGLREPFPGYRVSDIDHYWHPAVDIIGRDKDILVRLDIPGVNEKDIDISFDGHILAVSGERVEDTGKEVDGYLTRERLFGSFHRIIHLPSNIESRGLKANYSRGVLEILIPRKTVRKRKTIKVDVR